MQPILDSSLEEQPPQVQDLHMAKHQDPWLKRQLAHEKPPGLCWPRQYSLVASGADSPGHLQQGHGCLSAVAALLTTLPNLWTVLE